MKKRILIVEDEPELCKLLAVRFERKDYEVIVANDGVEGLSKARQEKPDLIILDLMLPRLPGEEVCKEIRKDQNISETPIIMLTAKTTDVDRVIGKVIGANAYMYKPFDSAKLIAEVERLTLKEK